MTQKYPITKKGYEKLQEELKKLKGVDRPQILEAIAEARSHGDLSENAEYHAAKEKQGFIEARIKHLEESINRAEIIHFETLPGDRVSFGSWIHIVDEDTDEKKVYQIVGVDEADASQGMISIISPLAQAMIGKKEKDSFEFSTPNGIHYYYIEKVELRT